MLLTTDANALTSPVAARARAERDGSCWRLRPRYGDAVPCSRGRPGIRSYSTGRGGGHFAVTGIHHQRFWWTAPLSMPSKRFLVSTCEKRQATLRRAFSEVSKAKSQIKLQRNTKIKLEPEVQVFLTCKTYFEAPLGIWSLELSRIGIWNFKTVNLASWFPDSDGRPLRPSVFASSAVLSRLATGARGSGKRPRAGRASGRGAIKSPGDERREDPGLSLEGSGLLDENRASGAGETGHQAMRCEFEGKVGQQAQRGLAHRGVLNCVW